MPTTFPPPDRLDHFVEREGVRFAGMHLLVDLWGGHGFDDLDLTEQALTDAVRACGATLLHSHLQAV
ncbi:hypothetical protein [Roseospira navarrensis]|uniref:Uncharacterized protein n=1 Tax=Roseospira navarrensis TaxID=140058 RepID=A0A7X1ZJ81_9PROT|nr:hypothetical protein [Roseospira navarrensis]MQX38235.1 hypothetical protein [Roseospira navarrensis]